MKANKIEHHGHRGLIVIGSVILLLSFLVGGKLTYNYLKTFYEEACIIRDMTTQVEIISGKMVKANVIADRLGLKEGANLAAIDFSSARTDLLKQIPNIRDIRISRRLPDKVCIITEERTPIARLGLCGKKSNTGRVVDSDGVVFELMRGTKMLPVIYEAQTIGTRKGEQIKARTRAALRFIEACRAPEFLELGILDVDTSKHDYLIATLGNYSKVKILWEDMDAPTSASHHDLITRLTRLRDAIRCKLTPETVIWNATVPGEIFADTQGKL